MLSFPSCFLFDPFHKPRTPSALTLKIVFNVSLLSPCKRYTRTMGLWLLTYCIADGVGSHRGQTHKCSRNDDVGLVWGRSKRSLVESSTILLLWQPSLYLSYTASSGSHGSWIASESERMFYKSVRVYLYRPMYNLNRSKRSTSGQVCWFADLQEVL